MDFALSEDQREIARSAREFLAERYPIESVRSAALELDAGDPCTPEQWREASELGWLGLAVPEADSGLGLGTVELVVLHEALGYALAPLPIWSATAALLLVAASGTNDQRETYLPALAEGELRAVQTESAQTELRLDANGLSGFALGVPDGIGADLLVVPHDGGTLVLRSDATGVDIRPIASLDPSRRLAEITFMNAAVEPLGEADIAAPDRARKAIAAALAAESVGVASFALDSAVAYAKEREQFGRPIGAYQAVSHVCAQMYRDVENARSAVLYAAWTVDHAPTDAPLAIAMATSCALEVGYTAPEAALQIFGGIGFSWEHHLHLWLKRGRSNAALGGGSRAARARVAELIGVARLREA